MPLRGNGIQPKDIIQVGPEGAILVGGTRMCLIEIVGGFQSIKEAVHRSLGEEATDILYEAGAKGARIFVGNAMRQGILSRDSVGFRTSVAAYARAGFGGFKVTQVNFGRRTATAICGKPMAFEAFAVKENGGKAEAPVCDYSRGVLAGFMVELSGDGGVSCAETACRVQGEPRCIFHVAPASGE